MADTTNNILMLFSNCTHIALRRKFLAEPSSGVCAGCGPSNGWIRKAHRTASDANASVRVACGGVEGG